MIDIEEGHQVPEVLKVCMHDEFLQSTEKAVAENSNCGSLREKRQPFNQVSGVIKSILLSQRQLNQFKINQVFKWKTLVGQFNNLNAVDWLYTSLW